MASLVSINFQVVPPERAVIPVMDRSFLYGDSVYEAVRTYGDSEPFLLDRHYARLLRSAGRIGMQIPFSEEELRGHLRECLKDVDHGDSYIRIVVSRGVDTRFDLAPNPETKPSTVIFVNPVHTYPTSFFEEGIKVALVSVRRNLPSAVDPNIKTGNYMNNVMALMEARTRGAKDAIMLNHQGMITEATTSNVFLVRNGVVMTPEVASGLLEGVSRRLLLDIMEREKIPYEVGTIRKDEFLTADEVFLTGTTKEIMPVTKIDDRPVGTGRPGEITRRLMDLFHTEVQRLIKQG